MRFQEKINHQLKTVGKPGIGKIPDLGIKLRSFSSASIYGSAAPINQEYSQFQLQTQESYWFCIRLWHMPVIKSRELARTVRYGIKISYLTLARKKTSFRFPKNVFDFRIGLELRLGFELTKNAFKCIFDQTSIRESALDPSRFMSTMTFHLSK